MIPLSKQLKMNLIKDGHGHSHRGLIGVEAAMIIIALTLVAAALAFVALNMGFSISQQAKTTIGSTLTSTSGNLEVEGKVIASSYRPPGGTASLNVTSIPINVARSGDSVNLDPSITAIKYLSNLITYDNIYNGTLNPNTFISLVSATAGAKTATILTNDPYVTTWPTETVAFIYWTVAANTNDILETGEHANLVVVFAASDRPEHLDKIRVEIIPAGGASLIVERTVPIIYNEVVDLS